MHAVQTPAVKRDVPGGAGAPRGAMSGTARGNNPPNGPPFNRGMGRGTFANASRGALPAGARPASSSSTSAAASATSPSSPAAAGVAEDPLDGEPLFEEGDEGVLGAKKKRAVRKTFRETELVSSRGLWMLYSEAQKLPLSRKPGKEADDMRHVMSLYADWARQLYSRASDPGEVLASPTPSTAGGL